MKFQIVNQILSKSFSGGKDFCPNPVENKNQIMKFLGFSKIWRKFSLKIYFQEKKKIFEMKYISRNFIPVFGKPQKFHDFIFSSPEF